MLIVGAKEAETNTVSVRVGGVKENVTIEIDNFIELVNKQIADKTIDVKM